jgi:iron complex outermembrane receptor protein
MVMRNLTALSVLVLALAYGAAAQAQQEPAGQGEAQSPPAPLAQGTELDEVVVTATRSPRPVAAIPGTVMVIGQDRIREQLQLSSNPADLLGKYVPGFNISNESVSGASETLRGRSVLVLVDGVPRNTPLRDVSRIMSLIDLNTIERIEVVKGSTSIYGAGATGGIVNFITKEAAADPLQVTTSASVTAFTADVGDSLAPEAFASASGDVGLFDYYLGAGGRWSQDAYDGNGDLLPSDPFLGQGGLDNAEEGDLTGKIGRTFGAQRVELSGEWTYFDQDPEYFTDYTSDPVRPDTSAPYTGKSIRENSKYARASYTHSEFLLGALESEFYYNDIDKRFPFTDASLINPLVLYSGNPLSPTSPDNQTELFAEQVGGRFSITTPLDVIQDSLALTWGFDYEHDKTEQEFVNGEEAIAPMIQDSYAVFGQLEYSPLEWLLLRGGVRQEWFNLDVDSFTRPAYYFAPLNAVVPARPVTSGKFDYNETVFNLGGVVFLSDEMEVFGGFSQGFALPDVGAFTRRAGIDDPFGTGPISLGSVVPQAQIVNTYELGFRGSWERFQGSFSGFASTSDEGTNFDTSTGRVVQQKELIYGVEATGEVEVTDDLALGAVAAYIEGRRDTDGDDDLDAWLPNNRIGAPFRMTLYSDYTTPFDLRLLFESVFWSGRDRDDGEQQVELKRAVLFNVAGSYPLLGGEVAVGIDNLLDKSYDNPTATSVRNAPVRGYGRTVRIGYSITF